MYKAGVVGCGFIGTEAPDSHLKAYEECPDTKLIAVCDINVSKLTHFTEYHTYTNPEQMARQEALDIISICTPVETHSEITCVVAPFTRALYVEKPIALTLEDADKMINVCRKFGVILQVNHQRRFVPVKARFSRGVVHTGTHMFDRLRQLFGELLAIKGNLYLFGNQWVEVEYVDSVDHIFEIDCARSSERMLLKGVEHLVDCLKNEHESISSGEEARKTLEVVLAFERLKQNPQK